MLCVFLSLVAFVDFSENQWGLKVPKFSMKWAIFAIFAVRIQPRNEEKSHPLKCDLTSFLAEKRLHFGLQCR